MLSSRALGLLAVVLVAWVFWSQGGADLFSSSGDSSEIDSVGPKSAETLQPENPIRPNEKGSRPVNIPVPKDPQVNRRFHTQSCDPSSEPLREIPAGGIVKWTDEKGITHYEDYHGDTRPAGRDLVSLFPDIKDYFSLDISMPSGGRLPVAEKDIQLQATRTYELYRTWLDDKWLSRAKIHLRLYTSEQQYAALRKKYVGADSDDVPGFYVARLNQAAILHTGNKAQTLRIVNHEVAHVINNQVFGELPRWLNEGLATYVEAVKDDSLAVKVTDKRLASWKANTVSNVMPVVSVRELLSATQSDWSATKRLSHYQLSQLLTYYLLQPQHRDFTLSLLRTLAAQKCSESDVESIIDQQYVGGLSGLSEDFSSWLEK
ncbi:MAG: DUF1570 domain-containing protein [Halioglobus sp.]